MKRLLFFLALGLQFSQAQAAWGYDIWVKNTTDKQLRVSISNDPGTILVGCRTPNRGDILAPHKEDSWPTHNICVNLVIIFYPDGSSSSIKATTSHHAFEVYKNEKGEYHWRNY